MTQEDLAAKTDLDRAFLSDIENCKKNVTIGTVAKIAKALKVKVRDLFSEEI